MYMNLLEIDTPVSAFPLEFFYFSPVFFLQGLWFSLQRGFPLGLGDNGHMMGLWGDRHTDMIEEGL